MSVTDARTVVPVAWMPDDRQLLVEVFSGKRGVALGLLDTVAAVSTSDARPVALPLRAPGTAPPLPLLVVAGGFFLTGAWLRSPVRLQRAAGRTVRRTTHSAVLCGVRSSRRCPSRTPSGS